MAEKVNKKPQGVKNKDITKKELPEKQEVPEVLEVKKPIVKKPLVHVSQFISDNVERLHLTNMQQAGFRAYMEKEQYKENSFDFIEPLNKYLGK